MVGEIEGIGVEAYAQYAVYGLDPIRKLFKESHWMYNVRHRLETYRTVGKE